MYYVILGELEQTRMCGIGGGKSGKIGIHLRQSRWRSHYAIYLIGRRVDITFIMVKVAITFREVRLGILTLMVARGVVRVPRE